MMKKILMSRNIKKITGSFRDPSGFLFERDGKLFRQVNESYKRDYDMLMSSGLYEALQKEKLLVPHREIRDADVAYKILEPERVPFISYPYEWCFSQLKDAALITLCIQKKALEHGMILKDASAYNVQFVKTGPIFIDTLSFEKYEAGKPWNAYRQFCQHFLAPLALVAYCDVRLSQLLRIHIDGIPLDLASNLLPARKKFFPSLMIHVVLHSRSLKHYSEEKTSSRKSKYMNITTMKQLVRSLESAINKIKWNPKGTEWGEYYSETNYSSESFSEKEKFVSKKIDELGPKTVWDLGANTGVFSRIASTSGALTISMDNDVAAVEINYLKRKKNLLPMFVDLTSPAPALGWNHNERMSLKSRGPADVVLALALIHHLVISNNLPFSSVAEFCADIGKYLIIEFVPKNDSNAQRLLRSREDIFGGYNQKQFESAFVDFFNIREIVKVGNSERLLYLMEKK